MQDLVLCIEDRQGHSNGPKAKAVDRDRGVVTYMLPVPTRIFATFQNRHPALGPFPVHFHVFVICSPIRFSDAF